MKEKGSMMNRTVKSAVAVAAIAAMSLGTLAACGSSTSGDDSKGKVYYLNFKPEAADQWAALAKEYTKEKGVEVKVQTAASGTYEQTLKSEIAKTEAPTLFQVNGPVGYQNWKKYTADMSNTDVYKGTYLPNYKKIFDLYITDSTTEPTQLSAKTGDDANSEFALGEAAFYQNGTWAWTDLQKAGMKAESVGMMPIYIGVKGEEKQGLATGSENYWCINDKASDADKKATEDFLSWVITSDAGKKALSQDMGFTTPFKTFDDVKSDNPLTEAAVEDQKSGKTQVSWNFTMMPSEEWKNKIGQALLEYAQGTGNWDAVKTTFVDGWASEYEASH